MGHYIRDPEAAAYLYQLAARDDYFAPLGESAEDEKQSGGVVVDGDRGLGPCNLT